MLRTVQFNDEFGRSAVEVYDKTANNTLFVNFDGVIAQKRYQSLRS